MISLFCSYIILFGGNENKTLHDQCMIVGFFTFFLGRSGETTGKGSLASEHLDD